jgi:hypothetical protein
MARNVWHVLKITTIILQFLGARHVQRDFSLTKQAQNVNVYHKHIGMDINVYLVIIQSTLT